MKEACKLNPGVPSDKTVPSKLFNGLVKYFEGDMDNAAFAYAVIYNKSISNAKLSDIRKDENGEPLLEDVLDRIDFKSLLKGGLTKSKIDVGAETSSGKVIEYDTFDEIIDNVIKFNNENKEYVANIVRHGTKYAISVEKRTPEAVLNAEKLPFQNNLSVRIRNLLKEHGFNVEIDKRLSCAGMFNPTRIEETTEGLKTVIRIAEGKLGEDALPEEYSHFIIEGLREDPFVQRLLNMLSDEIVQNVLGEDYDTYKNLYNNSSDLLKREAAAKILESHIVGNPIRVENSENVLSRLWNKVKNIFKSFTTDRIDALITDANRGFAKLASVAVDGSILPAINPVKFSNTFYSVAQRINKLEEIATRASEVAHKSILIRKAKSKTGKPLSKQEADAIKSLQEYIEHKEYAAACAHFLKISTKYLQKLEGTQKGNIAGNTLIEIKTSAKILRDIKEFSDGYSQIIQEMKVLPTMLKNHVVDMTKEDAEHISKLAYQLGEILDSLDSTYRTNRFNLLVRFIKLYYGDENFGDACKKDGSKLEIKSILELADHDIGFMDKMISSMSDVNDPLLSIVDRIIKTVQGDRDNEIREIVLRIKEADAKLKQAGYQNDFMIERDSNGKKTGYYISDIDFEKYYKDRELFIEQVKNSDLSIREKGRAIQDWENYHTEILYNEFDSRYQERIPARKYYKKSMPTLSQPQKEYYDAMLKFKQFLQTKIPSRYGHTYLAVQMPESLLNSMDITKPVESAKAFLSNLKDKFVKREFDMDWGETAVPDKDKRVINDFSNNPIQKIPVYFTGRLKNMDRLSTDVTASMIAFTSTAVNYSKMIDIVDSMELLRDYVKTERKTQQYSGNNPLVEKFTVLGSKFKKYYTKKGVNSTSERLDNYLDAELYGKRKEEGKTIELPNGEEISVEKSLDALKEYTTILGLGVNPFSGLSNVTIGKMQLWIEATSGEYFKWNDLIKARSQYWAQISPYLGELGSELKISKMSILVDRFDALEEFYTHLRETKYKGAMKKLLEDTSLLILQNIGEHYLHIATMYAMLNNIKVKMNGNEVSLYDALDINKVTSNGKTIGGEVFVLEGVTLSDGTKLFTKKMDEELNKLKAQKIKTSQDADKIEALEKIKRDTNRYLDKIKIRIGAVNHSLNGAFNDTDKGDIHRTALGRLIMQFRQWMPGHYYRRFASEYYDASLDQYREGYYVTLFKFVGNLIVDITKAKFQLMSNWKNLTPHQKCNMKRAFAETSIFAVLALCIRMIGPIKRDDNGVWAKRMLAYQLNRMYLETGASIPLTPDFFQNIWTLLQSPAAAIKSCNNLLNVFEFWNIFEEIESGRYKGWSVYHRDLLNSIPIYGQVRKTLDLRTENYMFNIYTKK